jgi:hypothetical protein
MPDAIAVLLEDLERLCEQLRTGEVKAVWIVGPDLKELARG